MTQNKRQFSGSVSVRLGACRVKFELSPAPLHGGPEGMFRVRVARRWIDGPEGQALFVDKEGLAWLIARHALADMPAPEPAPQIPLKSRVSVRSETEERLDAMGFTVSPPIRGCDGFWHVAVMGYGGIRFYPVHRLKLRR